MEVCATVLWFCLDRSLHAFTSMNNLMSLNFKWSFAIVAKNIESSPFPSLSSLPLLHLLLRHKNIESLQRSGSVRNQYTDE